MREHAGTKQGFLVYRHACGEGQHSAAEAACPSRIRTLAATTDRTREAERKMRQPSPEMAVIGQWTWW